MQRDDQRILFVLSDPGRDEHSVREILVRVSKVIHPLLRAGIGLLRASAPGNGGSGARSSLLRKTNLSAQRDSGNSGKACQQSSFVELHHSILSGGPSSSPGLLFCVFGEKLVDWL
jgi:hypothetical protein